MGICGGRAPRPQKPEPEVTHADQAGAAAMRIVAPLAQLVVSVASGGAFAGWVGPVGMRLLVRWLERLRPLRDGPLAACAAILLLCALLLSVAVTVGAWKLFGLLIAAPTWVGLEDSSWAAEAWR